jgi:light-regulated signal transduction histidine kinase (bacteriophytochrome)
MALRAGLMNNEAVRFGEADLTTCDREPIHIPGSIQPHGVLVVLDRQNLQIEQIAGDTRLLLGIEPERIPGIPVAQLLEPEAEAFVNTRLGAGAPFIAPIMRLGVRARSGSLPLDLTLHAIDRTAIMELEPARRTMTGAGDPIAQLKALLGAVQHTAGVEECCAAAAVAMRAATGFDRAMVYRFLRDGTGVIQSEDARSGLESFLGLHYPASDIPKQARELYRRNWLRAIPDIDYVPAPLYPPINRRTRQPIDMSHCDLRSVSPIHLEYLRNMGVCASLSASLVCHDALWGMLVLHHYSPRHVSADLRVACETFAQILSLHVEAKAQAETSALRIDARKAREQLVDRLSGEGGIGAVLASSNLLEYLGAGGGAVYLEGQLHLVGVTPSATEILALVHWLNTISQPLFATEHLSSQYPPAEAFAASASGLLAVGVSRIPRDYVLWFRPEIGRTVRWAGDPSKPIKVDRHGARLTPRGSFSEWLEVSRMRSASWSEVDLEAAEGLRVVLIETLLKNVDLARRERMLEATRAMAAELERRVAERTEQIRSLASDLEAAEERERRQIARDLHDDLGQTLAAARIRLSTLCTDVNEEVRTRANEVGALIDRANNAIRSLAAQLAPDVLHELGLSAALDWLGEEIERTFGLKILILDDGRPKPLSYEARSILYRAARELLINVAKHAGTERASVECRSTPDQIIVRVADDGVGYDAALVGNVTPRGLGLINVRERLSLIGGTADIHSTPGKGTVAVLTAPLQHEPSLRPGAQP